MFAPAVGELAAVGERCYTLRPFQDRAAEVLQNKHAATGSGGYSRI